MAQALSCRLLARRPRFDTEPVCVRYVVNKVALEQVLLRALHFPLSVSLFYQKDMQATPGNLHTSDALMAYWGALDRKP
jgi:hypothetical protein